MKYKSMCATPARMHINQILSQIGKKETFQEERARHIQKWFAQDHGSKKSKNEQSAIAEQFIISQETKLQKQTDLIKISQFTSLSKDKQILAQQKNEYGKQQAIRSLIKKTEPVKITSVFQASQALMLRANKFKKFKTFKLTASTKVTPSKKTKENDGYAQKSYDNTSRTC